MTGSESVSRAICVDMLRMHYRGSQDELNAQDSPCMTQLLPHDTISQLLLVKPKLQSLGRQGEPLDMMQAKHCTLVVISRIDAEAAMPMSSVSEHVFVYAVLMCGLALACEEGDSGCQCSCQQMRCWVIQGIELANATYWTSWYVGMQLSDWIWVFTEIYSLAMPGADHHDIKCVACALHVVLLQLEPVRRPLGGLVGAVQRLDNQALRASCY